MQGSTSSNTGTSFLGLLLQIGGLLVLPLALFSLGELNTFLPRSLQSSITVNHRIKGLVTSDANDDLLSKDDGSSDAQLADWKAQEAALKFTECQGKERILQIMFRAGMVDFRPEDCLSLPTWDEVVSLYGAKPIIHGLDSCAKYRDRLSSVSYGDLRKEPDVRVAGLFNTGTNAFVESLMLNFKDHGDINKYNAPGGKHVPLDVRGNRLPNSFQVWVNEDILVFVVVLIRDPFRWMNSMCKDAYKANWLEGLNGHCPNLVPSAEERRSGSKFRQIDTFRVNVNHKVKEAYDSLADMWSEWNRQFVDTDIPRLVIRFEDTLFHGEEVMRTIMECVGTPLRSPFKYHLNVSKTHGSPADFVTALSKYGREEGRYGGMLSEDMAYARTALDSRLMQLFHYPTIPTTFGLNDSATIP